MAYWDPFYPLRTLSSDIRAHVENWRRFKRAAKTWPAISIATYVMRFFLIVAGVVLGIWYQVRHDLTKGQGLFNLSRAPAPYRVHLVHRGTRC
ncbi:MAG: hypothetical protein WA899_02605, partial [Candidatus Sulfotelmatobacter sp.]